MPLSSMTGFARSAGALGGTKWTWELRSFNSRGLDVKCRLPNGYEEIEAHVREQLSKVLSRGSLQVSLQLKSESGSQAIAVNREILEQITGLIKEVSENLNVAPPSVDGILGLRGVLETKEIEESEAEVKARAEALAKDFDSALTDLVQARRREGGEIEKVLKAALSELEGLAERAGASAEAQQDAIKQRLSNQVAELLEASPKLPEERLAQEVALLATKADVREELDRLDAHMSSARDLLSQSGPVGRRLDFLMQEFNRETNTICSKSTTVELTNVGLELKAVIDRVREQVQNIE